MAESRYKLEVESSKDGANAPVHSLKVDRKKAGKQRQVKEGAMRRRRNSAGGGLRNSILTERMFLFILLEGI
jgi:hypothetical protein